MVIVNLRKEIIKDLDKLRREFELTTSEVIELLIDDYYASRSYPTPEAQEMRK